MKLMRIALTGSLLLFLAACGGDGPINPPTTTGTTTDGTTTGTTTGGTTGLPSTTGGTTGFPSTTGGTTAGGTTGFPSTTGGTTGATTGGTTGGTTTGGSASSISGTVFAPSGSSAAGQTRVFACYPTGVQEEPCDLDLSLLMEFSAGSNFPYTIDGLSAGQYAVFSISDADGNGSFEDAGDFVGFYRSLNDPQPVTPPATGIDFTMVVASSLPPASIAPEFKLSDAFMNKLLDK